MARAIVAEPPNPRTTTEVAQLLVLLPIYLAVLALLKGMQSVVSLLRPIAALLPDWVSGENFCSPVIVLIVCFAVGATVRTRAGRVVRERMEKLFSDTAACGRER